MRRLLGLTIFLLSISVSQGQEYKLITWEDLKPNLGYKDPFKALNLNQLQNLGKLARLKEKESNPDKSLTASEEEHMKRLKERLTSQNVDYDYLFSIYPEVMKMRKRKNEDLNTELDNTPIEISGYLLPLNFNKEKANEFLLVPWVGACIHTPPPPKNQIVYLKTKNWIKATELFEPVHLTGILQIDENSSELYLTDGTTEILTGYSMTNVEIFKL